MGHMVWVADSGMGWIHGMGMGSWINFFGIMDQLLDRARHRVNPAPRLTMGGMVWVWDGSHGMGGMVWVADLGSHGMGSRIYIY